jgi:hypothetical protein
MSIDSSSEEPVKEPIPNEAVADPVGPAKKNSVNVPAIILGILLALVSLSSFYLFATSETGICHDKIIQARIDQVNSMSNTTLVDTSLYDKGYAKGIADTQNSTLLLGYCSAQQEFVTNGALLMNNTTLVVPVTLLKEICFR